MALLEVKDVAFRYDSLDLFYNVNFHINPGDILCLIGPNGCGKTTLLDCLLGTVKPQTGTISLRGKDIKALRPSDIAKHIAYVPQDHEKSFPYSVLDIVLMGRAPYTGMFSSPSLEDRHIAEAALDLLGLKKLKERPYTLLSGGEGQLVMLARALAQKTPIIVMDEPTAHLDFKHELLIMETIVQLVRETGLAIIMATHFPNHAFYFENNHITTSVALMNQKTLTAVGSPTEILSVENIKSVYNINAKIISCATGENDLKQIIPINTLV